MNVRTGAVALGALLALGAGAPTPAPTLEGTGFTVAVADRAAWAGTDVAATVAQWAPVVSITVTDDTTTADIVLTGDTGRGELYAGSIRPGAQCTVGLAPELHGTDAGPVLAHEVGHCLGMDHSYSHSSTAPPSVMYYIAGGPQFSPTVTPRDREALRLVLTERN